MLGKEPESIIPNSFLFLKSRFKTLSDLTLDSPIKDINTVFGEVFKTNFLFLKNSPSF